ncbi:MAG TPA: phage tail tube protein [Gemmatimonadaceae bacterium]
MQRNTPGTVCRDYLGCKMDSVALSLSPKSGLGAKFNVFFQNQSIDGSPIAAALSTKNPIVFEQQGSSPILGSIAIGVGVEASVLSANITHSNNLLKDYFSLGNKNLVRGFPEQERKVSGTLVLDFATQTLMNDFLAVSANGNKTLVSLTIPLSCSDYADATLGIPYAFTLYIPKCFLSVYNQPGKTSGVLQQTVTFEAGESAPSANDALTIYHIGTSATAY